MNSVIDTNEYKGVGPVEEMYGHGPVTALVPDGEDAAELFICLDCGYTTRDDRMLAHQECDREQNNINQTWRERLEDREDDEDVLPTHDAENYPIEE